MSRSLLPFTTGLAATILASGGAALADVPSVAVDIAPVHSLVARVMAGVGEPDLILPPGATPHSHALRPSEARALQQADIVIWIGPELTPWLAGAIETLAPQAVTIGLLEVEGTTELALREGALFDADDHDGEDGSDLEAAEGDPAAGDADAHAGHEHGTLDPHAWLDPGNAMVWLDAVAAALTKADPGHAGAYEANAAAGHAELAALAGDLEGILEPLRGGSFVVFHDAYQYFERAFAFPAAGAISLSDAARPSPARVEEIHRRVADAKVTCVLAEPQFNPDLVDTVLDGTKARSAVIDPLGSTLAPGPSLYPDLLRQLGQGLADCLQP